MNEQNDNQIDLQTPKELRIDEVRWLRCRNRSRHILDSQEPPKRLVNTVHAFLFRGDELLVVRHKKRGWELPGGHREDGEEPRQAVLREIYEEAQAEPAYFKQLGYLETKVLEDRPHWFNKPYPLFYTLFYFGEILSMDAFDGDDEIVERKFLPIEDGMSVPWLRRYREFMNSSYELASQVKNN